MKHKLTKSDRDILDFRVDDLDSIANALSEQDILMELWTREEKCKLAPAGCWENEYTIAETFTFRTYMYMFLAIMTVVPLVFYIPYLTIKYKERKKIKEQFIQERMKVRTAVPIPIAKESDFNSLQDSYWGNRLIEEGIIYKFNI